MKALSACLILVAPPAAAVSPRRFRKDLESRSITRVFRSGTPRPFPNTYDRYGKRDRPYCLSKALT